MFVFGLRLRESISHAVAARGSARGLLIVSCARVMALNSVKALNGKQRIKSSGVLGYCELQAAASVKLTLVVIV
eukprot:16429080-Heterocapsa_arctica.AAC.1